MTLSGNQQVDLIEAVADAFNYVELSLCVRRIDVRLSNIEAEDGGMLRVAKELVDAMMRRRRIPEFLDALLAKRAGHPVFVAIRASLDGGAPAAVAGGGPGAGNGGGRVETEPHESYLLPDYRPFLDRGDFRAYIRHLNRSTIRIVTVNGNQDTGKTHSKQLIYHLAQRRKIEGQDEFSPICIDLGHLGRKGSRKRPKAVSGLQVAMELVNQIPAIEFPTKYETSFAEDKEQTTTWAGNVGSWLTGALAEDPRIYWVIIDGFGETTLEPSVGYLIDDLIHRVTNTLDSVRLILLGYGTRNFADLNVRPHEDRTEDLTEPASKMKLYKEVGRFLLDAHPPTFADLDPPTLVDRISELTTEVLASIDPDNNGQMAALADALATKARQLRGEA